MRMLQTILGFEFFRRLPRSAGLHAGLALAAITLLVGCATAPAEPKSMVDAQANFNDYKTFGWAFQPSPEHPLQLAEVTIREAITAEMQDKGYVEVAAGATADLLIDYDAARQNTVKNNPVRFGIGVGSYGSHGGASIGTSTSGVKEVTEGSLVIHAVDTARSAEVWRSGISRELGKGTVDSNAIRSIVAEVFSDFPARSATP